MMQCLAIGSGNGHGIMEREENEEALDLGMCSITYDIECVQLT